MATRKTGLIRLKYKGENTRTRHLVQTEAHVGDITGQKEQENST